MTRAITGRSCEKLYVSLVGVTSWTALHFKSRELRDLRERSEFIVQYGPSSGLKLFKVSRQISGSLGSPCHRTNQRGIIYTSASKPET